LARQPNPILIACTRLSTAGQPIKPHATEFEEDPLLGMRVMFFRVLTEFTASGVARIHEYDFGSKMLHPA
jgi:hypothetical protein